MGLLRRFAHEFEDLRCQTIRATIKCSVTDLKATQHTGSVNLYSEVPTDRDCLAAYAVDGGLQRGIPLGALLLSAYVVLYSLDRFVSAPRPYEPPSHFRHSTLRWSDQKVG